MIFVQSRMICSEIQSSFTRQRSGYTINELVEVSFETDFMNERQSGNQPESLQDRL